MRTPELAWIDDAPVVDRAVGDAAGSDLMILGPSLGTTAWVWEAVSEAIRRDRPGLRILRFDLPGHGASPPARDAFTMADLARAVLALARDHGASTFHYAGLSLGGAIGIELALDNPRGLRSLGVVSASARIATPETWEARATQVRGHGTASLREGTPARWFARGFEAEAPVAATRVLDELAQRVDDESYALCVDALRLFDRRSDVHRIATRVTVVNGSDDPVTTTDEMQRLALEIPRAVFVEVPQASHLVALERPAAVAVALR